MISFISVCLCLRGFLFLFSRCTVSLRLVEVGVEELTVRGKGTRLECRFDLQGETLYSVKWYKNGREFFRYLPRDEPPQQLFPLSGVHVNLNASNECQVTLKSLELSSSGRYRCEVSAEAPSFQTVSAHGDMITVALPEERPRIRGCRRTYKVGDTVSLTCVSGLSKPAALLMWFVNGQPANSSITEGPEVSYLGREGLEESRLRVEFVVEYGHFHLGGPLRVKCLANIGTVYWESAEESLLQEEVVASRPPALEVKDNTNTPSFRAGILQANLGSSGSPRTAEALLILIFLYPLR